MLPSQFLVMCTCVLWSILWINFHGPTDRHTVSLVLMCCYFSTFLSSVCLILSILYVGVSKHPLANKHSHIVWSFLRPTQLFFICPDPTAEHLSPDPLKMLDTPHKYPCKPIVKNKSSLWWFFWWQFSGFSFITTPCDSIIANISVQVLTFAVYLSSGTTL